MNIIEPFKSPQKIQLDSKYTTEKDGEIIKTFNAELPVYMGLGSWLAFTLATLLLAIPAFAFLPDSMEKIGIISILSIGVIVGISMGFFTNKKINSTLNFINKSGVPPHTVVPDFVEWKERDTINMKVSFDGSKSADYVGVTEDMMLAFRSKKDRYFLLPPNFFVNHYKNNADLEKRKQNKLEARIKKEVKDSSYSDFLEAFRKAYREQKGEELNPVVHRTHLGNGYELVEFEDGKRQRQRVKARA